MEVLKNFQTIPGVGKSMARDFVDLGYEAVDELKNENPVAMYEKLMALRGQYIDRCVLYVFCCAVYYAGNSDPDPDLLNWWN